MLFFQQALNVGCTVCDSALGQEIRRGIFEEHFWSTLAAVIAPFPVLLAAIAAIHRLLPEPNLEARGENDDRSQH